jgi:heme oxygenase
VKPLATMRRLLREATAASHARLEHSLDLLGPSTQATRFRALLERFHGFHRVWEPALADTLGCDDFLVARQREPLLHADLLALGMRAGDIAALPACTEAAGLCRSAPAALGSLYVLEGSTLGGRHIARHLAGAPWLPPGGLRYFDPHGAHTGQRWQETLARLEGTSAAWQQDVADAAVATFELLHRWLPPAGAGPATGARATPQLAETVS